MSTPVTSANFGINGWGTAAKLSVAPFSTQNRGQVTVTATAGGIQNPYIVLTYPDGAYPVAPLSLLEQSGGTGQASDLSVTATNSYAVYVYGGFPIAGNIYVFTYDVLGI